MTRLNSSRQAQGKTTHWRALLLAGSSLLWTLVASNAAADVSQTPLLLGGGNVPGNLALVPSVEFPTVISVANLGNYSHTQTYAGYFDSDKCYKYIEQAINHPFFGEISASNGGGYFTPMRYARDCTISNEWSGNYLNWATTQTIDPFRKALTGGYRIVDTESLTLLEKATRAGNSSYFPNRTVSSSLADEVSPHSGVVLTSSVTSGTDYQKNKTVRISYPTSGGTAAKYYSVRVEVCKPGLLESNCVKYGVNSWKPEGLLQQYAKSIRYSVFSYLNQDGTARNGGVLRSNQKYIGQTMRTRGVVGEQANTLKEWNSSTGILFQNPHDSSTGNSGVINYINKFGELTNDHKSNDPVSELYYTALRYFKKMPNISGYSNITSEHQKDGFPVVTDWEDPMQYACQKNVILGIGDVYTHADRDLPHSDDTLDVAGFTQQVFNLEGISKTASAEFTGRNNSAYIAGLAYYANITDLRSDFSSKQTISTHWVDVRENEYLEPKGNNQYWLAAKYGGFKVPKDYEAGDAIDESWWWTTGETLSSTGDKRPDNFYVASDATRMVESLKTAFARIAKDVQSTTAALSTNSTRLDTGTAVFQSLLDSADWSGDLLAKAVATDGTVATTPSWRAASKLDALTNDQALTRDIFTSAPPTTDIDTGAVRSTTGSTFTWAGLTDEQKLALRATAGGTLVTETLGQQRLDFIKGDRSQERTDAAPNLPFRERGSRLGDIANSDPQYIHKPNFGYAQLPASAGFTTGIAAAYTTFRNTTAYQSRPPLVVVGANDGMLHGFNASLEGAGAGAELFAYVPNDVIDDLYELTEPTYAHRYYVDGTARLGDAWVDGAWKTLAIGSTGAGGRSIFALDITDPGNMTADSVLWEFTHPEMGYTLGRPSLVPLPNGKFGVVVTSGYERSTETTAGYVWVLDAADGSILRQFDLPNSGDLGAPLAVDLDNDRVTDRIYVGDTQGNVWRLDIEGSTATGWDAPSALKSANAITPLFIALDRNGNRQPITAPLDAAYTKDRDIMLVFGTGSFYKTTDNEIPESPQVQSFYGIIDGGSQISGRSSLLEQEILIERSGTTLNGRGISQREMTDSHKGWYLDLVLKGGNAKGERVISQAQLGGNRVTFSSLIPSDNPCDAGGRSWIMSLDLSTGGRLAYSYFDYNGDGKIDQNDYIQLEDGTKIPVSGISDPDDGAVKGTIGLNDRTTGKRYLCYASSAASVGSNGVTPVCIEVMGDNNDSNRLSWHEVRQ
ncbi:pilus assembly protein [Stutzerimonas urumqiensis]|uniref:pilus assembly protein n=1 Tax=Stutzerimonas urumqiensis TaxID=638269 RepID=UPI003DA39CA7